MMSGIQNHREWRAGMLVGLAAATLSTVALLAVGVLSGRGSDILADAGTAVLPADLRAATGTPAVLSYLMIHIALYMLAGAGVMALVRLADRIPAFITGLVLLGIIFELSFLVLTAEGRAMARFDGLTWRALLIAHAVGDLAFVLGLVRVHPGIRQALVRGYGE